MDSSYWNLTEEVPILEQCVEIGRDNKSILMRGDFDTRDHSLRRGSSRNVDTVFVEGTQEETINLDEEVKFTENSGSRGQRRNGSGSLSQMEEHKIL